MTDEHTPKIAEILQRLEEIEARNRRVTLDKEWETSTARKLSILATTYIAMCILFITLGNDRPLTNAVVPTLGFFLSTLTLPIVRDRWKRSRGKSSPPPVE